MGKFYAIRVFVYTFVFIGSIGLAYSQQSAKMTPAGVGYLEHLPSDYTTNTSRQYPVIIFFHGLGEVGNGSPSDLNRLKVAGPPKLIDQGHPMCFTVNGVEECFIVISPQLRSDAGGWWPSILTPFFDYILNGSQNYRIDRNRVYLTGLSLGGEGVYIGLGLSPDVFAAAGVIAGFDNGNGCTISARKIPVWGFHGQNDTTVPYALGLSEFNRTVNCTTPAPTAELKWTSYAGVAHNAWDKAYTADHSVQNPNIYEWFLSKTKNVITNNNPVANAGIDKTITLPVNTLILTGSGTDSDGTISAYSWTKVSGPNATLTNANTATLNLSNLTAGAYLFRLTVTDNSSATSYDDVNVIVNQPPVADAGTDKFITLPLTTLNLIGTGSDPDGYVNSYQWTKLSGPNVTLSNANTSVVSLSGLLAGTYVFRLAVTDNSLATAYDNVTLTVSPMNLPPVVNAGADVSITLPVTSVILSGSSSDPEGITPGNQWTQISGPATATLTNANATTVTISNLVAGSYVFRLTSTDLLLAVGYAEVNVFVNQPPSANAGSDKLITLPTNTLSISGSGSDPDGTIASYLWTKVSGPSATLTNTNTATLNLSNLTTGSFVFRLAVTDNRSASVSDDVNVRVNQPPIANAGLDKVIITPASTLILAGSGVDPDGSISSYQWTKVSGPSAILANDNTPTLNLSSLVAGSYVFRLTIVDNVAASVYDEVNIIVNQPPVADAGTDKLITLPVNTLTLSGNGSDVDGTISSYQWTEISGQNPVMANANTATLSLSNLVPGAYVFRLTVTDNWSTSSSDVVNVFVNQAPIVNAGTDKIVMLPETTLSIAGSGYDPDGTIASFQWTVLSGNGSTLSNANTSTLNISTLTAGTYVFRLTATDNLMSSSYDDVTVTVMSNQTPIANAGTDQVITLPLNSLVLIGSGTDMEGSMLTYQWAQISGSGATLSNENTAVLGLSNLVAGAYMFRLTVTDNSSLSAYDDVNVFVNQSPTVNAGQDKIITLPANALVISGTANDPDGSIISYQWTQLSGTPATLANANTLTLNINNLIAGSYAFRLTVIDDQSVSVFDDVSVFVNKPPTVNAGTDKILTLPANTLSITGIASDTDGSITSYQWTQLSGTVASLSTANTPTVTISSLVVGTYTFRLTVTDNLSTTAYDDVIVSVNPNLPPVVSAGPDRIITLPATSLNISGSGTDPEGSAVTYQWTKISGGNATLINAATATLTVNGLSAGAYLFRLTVTDNLLNASFDDVNVTVNQPPVVNAGTDKVITLPTNSLSINGTGTDPDGSVISYQWTKISGGNSTLTNANTATLALGNLAAGSYLFRLTVTDNLSGSSFDDVNVIVNRPPSANAGVDKLITLPANTLSVTGSGTDPDGSVVAYQWTKISGPAVTLTNANTSTLSLSNLLAGSYVVRLTVSDNMSATAFDDVTVIVNQPPVVNAGSDKLINWPSNSLVLSGSATDADGSVASYLWTKVSGPTATLANAATASLSLSNLLAGSYVFRLTATDNVSGSAYDDVTIIVNQPPVVNASTDKIITLPLNSLVLSGSATDADGSVSSYSWTKISGPTATLANTATASLSLSNLLTGSYVFRLTATDNVSGSAYDDVTVTVAPSKAPPVAFAGNDVILNTPANTLTLIGNGTDTDGTSITYAWTQVSGTPAVLSGTDTFTLSVSGLETGVYTFRLSVTDNDNLSSADDVIVTVDGEINLALRKPVTISSIEYGSFPAIYAVDGNLTTRWSSQYADTQWIYVDLGASYTLNRVKVTWEKAFAADYLVQVSSDASSWTTIKSITGNTQLINNLTDFNGTGRYLRVYTTKRATEWGYSIFELEAYGQRAANLPPVADAGKDITIMLPENTVTLYGNGSDADGTITSYSWTQQSGPSFTFDKTTSAALPLVSLSAGTYVFQLSVTDNEGLSGSDNVTVVVNDNVDVNLALKKNVVASSIEYGAFPAVHAVDGSMATRWSSQYSDIQWIYVDLGASYTLNRVKITWEKAYAVDYLVQVSPDESTWTTIKSIVDNAELTNDMSDIVGTGRYLRITMSKRATQWGYSIFELEAYGKPAQEILVTSAEITVSLFPVPATDYLMIDGVSESTSFTILNSAGLPVQQGIYAGGQIDISQLLTGIYFINIQVENKTVSKRFMKL